MKRNNLTVDDEKRMKEAILKCRGIVEIPDTLPFSARGTPARSR